MSRFSVVIPTRNRPQFLRTAIESVLAQTLKPQQILVVDDGEGAHRQLRLLEPVVRVLDNGQRGPVAARILGISHATAEFIAFLDDDDWWTDPQYLESAARMFDEGADLCFGDGKMIFEDGRPPLAFAFDADAASLERDNTILISSVSYRRALHDGLGDFDLALPYYWDWDWYLRVAQSGARLRRLAKPVVAIRVHPQNMSGDSREHQRRADLVALERKHGLAPIPLKNHLDIATSAPGSFT